ncbi:hypothetical protein [Micromonospora coxensis]|uniref:hypothetical protein n=1 Tax=Micromonospora coxensis TaxID=356852 RepID=UPI003422EB45
MTVVRGLPFDPSRALEAIAALLTGPVPSPGSPTVVDSDPQTGEWVATRAAGFVLAPLWEGPDSPACATRNGPSRLPVEP